MFGPKVTGFVLPPGLFVQPRRLDDLHHPSRQFSSPGPMALICRCRRRSPCCWVLMVSSKGILACRALRSSWWRRCLPMFNLPEAGVLLILGIDHFLDMGRTLTNVMGNAIATAVVVVGGAIDPVPDALAEREEMIPAPGDDEAARATA